jgi:hypothetical protein
MLTGIVLVVLGALVLAYQGINYTSTENVLDLGPIHATTETDSPTSDTGRDSPAWRGCVAGHWHEEESPRIRMNNGRYISLCSAFVL